MIENKKALFENGSILTKEMLESLRDNTSNYIELMYKNYSDGIIKGFELFAIPKSKSNLPNNKVKITEGFLKFNNKIYYSNAETILELPNEKGIYYYIKIKFKNTKDHKFEINSGEIIISKEETKADEFELGKVKYTGGDINFTKSVFEDFKEIDCKINILNTKYSTPNGNSIAPEILYFFGKEMLAKSNIEYSPMDLNIALLCVNKTVSHETIVNYINFKIKQTNNQYSNKEIYEKLNKILTTFKPTLVFTELSKKEDEEKKKEEKTTIL